MAKVSVEINGKKITREVSDNTMLSDFLRDKLSLTGTHIGCDTSQCGAGPSTMGRCRYPGEGTSMAVDYCVSDWVG